jgi:hypothetical protein
MNHKTASLLVAILVGIIGLSLVGCARAPVVQTQPKTMPQLLTEAGFKAFPANAPYASEYMQKCAKNTLMIHTRGGTTVYCYVDQATNTMYHGDEAAYQRLQSLLQSRQQTVPEQKIENDPMFWRMWESSRGLG